MWCLSEPKAQARSSIELASAFVDSALLVFSFHGFALCIYYENLVHF